MMTGAGFAIRLVGGELAAKSGDKYNGPITTNPIQARFFGTSKGAETTLAKLQRDGAYGRKFVGATIVPVLVNVG